MLLDVVVCLPKEAETVGLIRAVLKDGLSRFGVTGDCIDDILLALIEAGTNVVEHAVADDEYEVGLEIDEFNCAITIRNTGEDFDAAALGDLMPDPSSPRGRGVAIMRAVTDQVDLDSTPTAGTIVKLVKSLDVTPDGPLARVRDKHRR